MANGIAGPASTLSPAGARATIAAVERAVRTLQAELGFRATHRYAHALTGFAARLTPSQVQALRHDPRVAALSPSRVVELAGGPPPEVVPTGVRRVHAQPPVVAGPVAVDVAIIDTGLSPLRTDELDIQGGTNCVPREPATGTGGVDPNDWSDIHGHGTHVAGTVAAMDNDIGVVGVAPGARIWAARVFGMINGLPRGRTEWITCAIDWVASLTEPVDPSDPDGPRRPVIEVVNMSLAGGGTDSPCSLGPGSPSSNPDHDAICASVADGTTYVVAAGNDAKDIQGSSGHVLPAAFDEVIAVAALSDTDGQPGGHGGGCSGPDDGFATYSDFGVEVDLIAPGSCILSLSRSAGGLATMSGTSMASPAVAGAAAVYLATHPGVAADPSTAPAKVRKGLRAAATLDWRWPTDPDGDPDRLLDVGAFLAAQPGIALWASPDQAIVGGGQSQADFAIDLSRAGGFTGPVDLSLGDGPLPAGVTHAFAAPTLATLGGIETTLTLTIPPDTPDGVYPFTVEADASGGLHAEATTSLMVDRAPPDVDGPRVRFVPGGTLLSLSAPLEIGWTGSDAVSGMDRYRLRQRVDGGTWLNIPLPSALAESQTRQGQFGKGYEFEVRALDRAGNETTTQTPVLVATLRQSTHADVIVGPGWRLVGQTDASGGDLHRSRQSGASLTFEFTGRGVAWAAPVGPKQGHARVFIDDVDQGRVDLASPTKAHRRLVFVAGWDVSGPHSIRIVVRGGASAKSVGVDAFLVLTD